MPTPPILNLGGSAYHYSESSSSFTRLPSPVARSKDIRVIASIAENAIITMGWQTMVEAECKENEAALATLRVLFSAFCGEIRIPPENITSHRTGGVFTFTPDTRPPFKKYKVTFTCLRDHEKPGNISFMGVKVTSGELEENFTYGDDFLSGDETVTDSEYMALTSAAGDSQASSPRGDASGEAESANIATNPSKRPRGWLSPRDALPSPSIAPKDKRSRFLSPTHSAASSRPHTPPCSSTLESTLRETLAKQSASDRASSMEPPAEDTSAPQSE